MSSPDDLSSACLRVEALSFARDEEPIFGPLSFALAAGEAVALEGGNGSGKTTLLRVLAGLLTPTEGRLDWMDSSPSRAFLGHQLGLKQELAVLANLEFAAGLNGRMNGASPNGCLASVGLDGFDDTPVRRLSAGQKKRVALARLLLCPARIWLLDEPYANLDREGQVLVDRLIEKHCAAGGSVVFSSHGLGPVPPRTRQRIAIGGPA